MAFQVEGLLLLPACFSSMSTSRTLVCQSQRVPGFLPHIHTLSFSEKVNLDN